MLEPAWHLIKLHPTSKGASNYASTVLRYQCVKRDSVACLELRNVPKEL
jgi:hypothetical protein